MKRSALRRGTSQLKRTRLAPMSKKRKEDSKEYYKLRNAYMKEHPVCEVCGGRDSQDLHHKHGRGIYYLTVEYFMAVCRYDHTKIHENPNWAREQGYLL